jgi:serine/threonine-protein kinase
MSQPSSPALLAPGVIIAGKYRLTHQLGRGAMGTVWAAVHQELDRTVALKLIDGPEPELRHRLRREARALGALTHRNIVDIYDVGWTDGGDPFLVMQMLTGETLSHRLAETRRLDASEAARIGRDVARALAAAHAIPIVHRDLKPANVFLHRDPGEPAPIVKVLDFGVAKNLASPDGHRTELGAMVGSLPYMSPEQVRGQGDVDHRADIWALGALLFELLTGVRAFRDEPAIVLGRLNAGDVPRMDRFVRHIDPELVEIVSRCMRPNRDERIASAAEVAALLDRFAEPSQHAIEDAGNALWTERGTMRMTPLQAARFDRVPRVIVARAALPPGSGAAWSVPGLHIPDDFEVTIPHVRCFDIDSTTAPLVRHAEPVCIGPPPGSGRVAGALARRRAALMVSVAGTLLGLGVAAAVLAAVSGAREPIPPERGIQEATHQDARSPEAATGAAPPPVSAPPRPEPPPSTLELPPGAPTTEPAPHRPAGDAAPRAKQELLPLAPARSGSATPAARRTVPDGDPLRPAGPCFIRSKCPDRSAQGRRERLRTILERQ